MPPTATPESTVADPPGRLAAARHLLRGFLGLLAEDEAPAVPSGIDPEKLDRLSAGLNLIHRHLAEPDALASAAGIVFVTPDGRALLVRRSDTGDHAGEWAFPGGGIEDNDADAESAARREALEELGRDCPLGETALAVLDRRTSADGVDFTTFLHPVASEFAPQLNDEHTEHLWANLDDPPEPLHPGAALTLARLHGEDDGEEVEDEDPEARVADPGELPPGALLHGHPVKALRHGEWSYAQDLLEAAARQARLRGRTDLARRVDEIRAREFPPAADATQLHTRDASSPHYWETAKAGAVGTGPKELAMSREVKRDLGQDWSLTAALDNAAMAFDRDSAREKDADGRLKIAEANISKANVCPYYGREIPDYEKLGLDPARKYRLLRDPEELRKAVGTFNLLPILSEHRPTDVDSHPQELTVGSTGTDADFDGTYLKNSLVFWPRAAIDDIESNAKKQLSCAYRYRADMTPGEHEGEPYDGVMRDLVGNHVALVKEGRAGPDVMVADAMPKGMALDSKENVVMANKPKLAPRALIVAGALHGYLRPRMAADQKLDFLPGVLKDVTAKNFATQRPVITAAITAAVKGKLATDADVEDLGELLEAMEKDREGMDDLEPNAAVPAMQPDLEQKPVMDSPMLMAKIKEFLADKLPPETLAQLDALAVPDDGIDEATMNPEEKQLWEDRAADARARLGRDETPEERAEREKGEKAMDAKRARDSGRAMDRRAMDNAITTAVAAVEGRTESRVRDAVATERRNQREIREAVTFVRPWVGELAMDAAESSADVYRAALTGLGVKLDGVPPEAFRVILENHPRPGASPTRRVAQDGAPGKGFFDRFPEAKRIGLS